MIMRHAFLYILSVIVLVMVIPLQVLGNDKKIIDFNFPQDVSKLALDDLDKALKSGDGQLTVDALVRYSIAQSGISQDNMPDIIEHIETTITKEKQPHIKALLYYFEALVYQGYHADNRFSINRSNPVEETPADISEWDHNQFVKKIAELVEKSLAEPEHLKQVVVTSLPGIIKCNELGATYVPTLFEFLSMKGLEIMDESDKGWITIAESDKETKPIYDAIYKQWVDCTEGNVPAHIFAICEHNREDFKEAYERYRDNEHCGMLLLSVNFNSKKEAYAELKGYLERFPNSVYCTEVKNRIIKLENKNLYVRYPTVRSTSDSIEVKCYVMNANEFMLNVYRVNENVNDNNPFDPNKMQLINQVPVKVQGTIPFETIDVKTTLAPLPYGQYVIIPKMEQETERLDIYQDQLLRVTDIALFTVVKPGKKVQITTVDMSTGKPVPDVTIKSSNQNSVVTCGNTGSDGLLRTDVKKLKSSNPQHFAANGDPLYYAINGDSQFFAVRGDDQYGPTCEVWFHDGNERDDYICNIYTDLGVYRPGETIHWAAIVQHIANEHSVPVSGKKIWIGFSDSNYEEIDSLVATTDKFGRIEGSFTVPKDRMNGDFSLTVESRFDDDEDELGEKEVTVSEYKTPTFDVTFPDPCRSYVSGQPVKVTGKAMTYSGLPVQNTEVQLSLFQDEWSWWWWRMRGDDGEYLMDTTVVTDDKGFFTIEFPAELFMENKDYKPGKRCWARYYYQVVATVTNDAGETHEESTSFIVGTRRGIELGSENDDTYFNDKPIKLPLKYNTTDEEHPNTYCTWEITPIDAKEPVLTGNLNTAYPTIDLTGLPSGQYRLNIHILDAEEGEEDVDADRIITIYRKGDKTSPVKDCPLWLTPLEQTVDKKNVGHVTIGVSTPEAYIYYVAMTSDGIIGEGWLHYKKGMHDFTIQLPKEAGKDVDIRFITHYGTQNWTKYITLKNPYLAETLKITATSFRDKLVPGDTEHWTFTLTDQNGKPQRGAMILDMYDKAISGIQANPWYDCYHGPFDLYDVYFNELRLNDYTYSQSYWNGKRLEIPESAIDLIPELNTYGQAIYSNIYGCRSINNALVGRVDGVMHLGAHAVDEEYALFMPTFEGRVAGVQVTEHCEKEVEVVDKNLDKVTLRESDVKTALWKPMLTSDNKGNISVEFEAPNFNTTWITQAVAWNKKMLSSTWMAEVLTQKPLMVRSNMPRFLRQGDVATLAATVQNATDEAATCDAVIELFDPRSGDIYATRKFNLSLDPSGSQAVNIDWTVPDTIAMVGFRIKAANDRFGDGEQVMVPVLTTISPVIETQSFYVEAGQGHFEEPLPDFPADARVTLEYCDNPLWYSVLALPTIFSDQYNVATHAAHSLFALMVAQGVAKEQPLIKEAITYWKDHNEDSILVSMLQKNQDLKIGTLLASPWMSDADYQTLRMSKLNELFDEAIVKKEYEKIITALQSLQMDDGGFTWFRNPDCKSNARTTGTVLELIGEIKHLGYLTDDSRLNEMTRRALDYYDSENVRQFNEYKKYIGEEPYDMFTDYAYVRSLFPEVKQHSDASTSLFKNVLKFMDKNWNEGITLKQKGYYAMTLNRNGYQNTARSIVESIRQFAIVKPELGMYWDNLQKGYFWWEFDKVAYTSTILQAMNEVDPRKDEIDLIRKWMLLMKQSNGWGSQSLAADAVYSILSTGSKWLERNALPTITIAGQSVNLDKMAEWLGYFRTTLPATTTGNVVIDRTDKGPAWGAVYSQFKAPMTQIQEKAIEEMSISKEYYVYAQDGSLHKTDVFKVGDKVKVRVIIKTNKDMDFVTMTDERAACFEPVDQLSGYRNEDRAWFYQETKDSQTNLFFNSLNKGTHIIGYDVWVTNPGEFTSGIATIQCQYAPQLSAHSAGKAIIVNSN